MEITKDEISGLIERPSEGLNTEIKGWIDPSLPEGIAKIIKATFALRNRNGGFLLIGFDDASLQPDTINPPPEDVRQMFHVDVIQGIVSKYSSEPFEVQVAFGKRDEKVFPIIKVAEGVRSPVAVRRDLMNGSGSYLIREGEVFVRTLGSNGTPSSARAKHGDWPNIVEICFENREADIGRFFRRHLVGKEVDTLIEVLTGLRTPTAASTTPTLHDEAKALLAEGEQFYQTALAQRSLTSTELTELDKGVWRIALVVDPPRPASRADREFLNTALSSNPQLTGWPIWLDPRGLSDREAAPCVVEKAWQALIVSLSGGWSKHVDFMRLDPKGRFFLQRVLPDDLTEKVTPGTELDAVLIIIRVAEAIVVGLKMAEALGWGEGARLGIAFEWTKLSGRELSNWANRMVNVPDGFSSHTDMVDTFVEIPANTPISAIAPYVEEATRDLFLTFDGCSLPAQAFEDWCRRLLERRL